MLTFSPKHGLAGYNIQQKLESESCRFCCGDFLLDDSHPLSKLLVQKQSITCESRVESCYYNVNQRRLKLDVICIHRGTLGSPDFLFGTKVLREKWVSGGFECRPICKQSPRSSLTSWPEINLSWSVLISRRRMYQLCTRSKCCRWRDVFFLGVVVMYQIVTLPENNRIRAWTRFLYVGS